MKNVLTILLAAALLVACAVVDTTFDHEAMWVDKPATDQKALEVPSPTPKPVWKPKRLTQP